jgi:hypothetical protein
MMKAVLVAPALVVVETKRSGEVPAEAPAKEN